METQKYQIIEAVRKNEWEQSTVWQGAECRVRTKGAEFLPEVLTYFYNSKDGDYQSLDYPYKSVKIIEQAIELAQVSALKIRRDGCTAKQILEDGTAARSWNNIEAQD